MVSFKRGSPGRIEGSRRRGGSFSGPDLQVCHIPPLPGRNIGK
jgi:hypothetical protein